MSMTMRASLRYGLPFRLTIPYAMPRDLTSERGVVHLRMYSKILHFALQQQPAQGGGGSAGRERAY